MSVDDPSEEEEIEVKHTYSNDYSLRTANGVAGGIQPHNEMKIDFTYDHNYSTESETYGKDGQLKEIVFDNVLQREHQVGVSMHPDDAQDAAIWILSHTLGESVTREEIVNGLRNAIDEGDGK